MLDNFQFSETMENISPEIHSRQEYKFKFRAFVAQRVDRIEAARRVRKECGIQWATWNRYLNVKRHENQDVPSRFLKAFAKEWGVTVDELYNY